LKLQQAAQPSSDSSSTGASAASASAPTSTLVLSKPVKSNATKSSATDAKGASDADKQAGGERRRNKPKMNGFGTGSADSNIDGTTWRVSNDKKTATAGGEVEPSSI